MTTVIILKVVSRDAMTILLNPFPRTRTFIVTCNFRTRRRYARPDACATVKTNKTHEQMSTEHVETDKETAFGVSSAIYTLPRQNVRRGVDVRICCFLLTGSPVAVINLMAVPAPLRVGSRSAAVARTKAQSFSWDAFAEGRNARAWARCATPCRIAFRKHQTTPGSNLTGWTSRGSSSADACGPGVSGRPRH